MSVEEVVGSLKAHEERLKGIIETSQGQLLLTKAEWRKRESNGGQLLLTREEWLKRNNGNGTRSGGENRGKDGNRGVRDKSRVRCYNCQGLGHFAGECHKPRKERELPREVNFSETYEDEPALLMAEVTEEKSMLLKEDSIVPKLRTRVEEQRESQVWYLDNGPSNHMTGQRGKFKELDERVTGKVKFGDGSTVNIEGKGSVAFQCKNGEEKLLKEVYYIPNLCNNIISLGQLSEAGNKVIIEGEFLWVYENGGKLLMKVKKTENRLYKINLEESKSSCLLTKVEENTWLWHNRLGHVNFRALELMSREKMAHGIPEITQPLKKCEGCLMSKQTRQPFPLQAMGSSRKKLEIVHADICGPITPTTSGGNRYFLLFVDDYSRKMWVYFLKEKSGAFEMFKKFKALVENGTECSFLRSRVHGGHDCSLSEYMVAGSVGGNLWAKRRTSDTSRG